MEAKSGVVCRKCDDRTGNERRGLAGKAAFRAKAPKAWRKTLVSLALASHGWPPRLSQALIFNQKLK